MFAHSCPRVFQTANGQYKKHPKTMENNEIQTNTYNHLYIYIKPFLRTYSMCAHCIPTPWYESVQDNSWDQLDTSWMA